MARREEWTRTRTWSPEERGRRLGRDGGTLVRLELCGPVVEDEAKEGGWS